MATKPNDPEFARREFLQLLGVSSAMAAMPGVLSAADSTTASSPATAKDVSKAAQPNILIFLTDDHGQWAQHCYGNSELKTPNLDRLANGGTRMTRAFTSCPVCSPARASLWTGRMPSQHGIHDWIVESEAENPKQPGLKGQVLLSELLQKAGYHTALVGKWHCGRGREPQPGFDRWFSYWFAQYPHDGLQNFTDQGKHVQENGQQSPFLTDRAIQFLKSHREDSATAHRPFFLCVGYVDTHSPHDAAPKELVSEYQQATFADIPKEKFATCHGKATNPVAANPQAEHAKRMEYYGAVASIDREVGRILDELESSGQLENTLIIYTGDHGLNCGHHGVWEKGNATLPQNFLDESILVSCTWHWPKGGIVTGAAVDRFVNHCDTFATLLEVAGATPDAATAASINSPGRSYLPFLRGEQPAGDWADVQFSEYGNARMIRTEKYKLILRYPYKGVVSPDEFYDLAADPRETVNKYNDPAMASVVADLRGQLDRYFATYSTPEHDGLRLAEQPQLNKASPWIVMARQHEAELQKQHQSAS